MDERQWNQHSIVGAQIPQQGAGQTLPQLHLLCFSCGWMNAGDYHSHFMGTNY